MKKLFLLVALLVTASVFASEAAVKDVIKAYRKADAAFDLKMFDYLTDDFSTEIMGKKIDRPTMFKTIKSFRTMLETDDLELFVESAMRIQGVNMTADQRKKIRAMKDSEKKTALQLGKEQVKQLQKFAAIGANNLDFKKCVVNGNNAVAVVSFFEPVSGTRISGEYILVKKNGKWLIKSLNLQMPQK